MKDNPYTRVHLGGPQGCIDARTRNVPMSYGTIPVTCPTCLRSLKLSGQNRRDNAGENQ